MARVVLRDADEERARADAETLARALAEAAAGDRGADGARTAAGDRPAVDVAGPAPCPVARIADRWRMQVEITAPGAAELGRFLTPSRNAGLLRPGEAMAVDVDPVALM
ncbi:MAG: hypothetical protein ACKOV8_04575 [Phycisphaerales bacterium]